MPLNDEPFEEFPSFSIDRYRILVEQADDIIYEADPLGFFTFVNSRAAEILGYSRSDFLTKKYTDLIRADFVVQATDFYKTQLASNTKTTYFEFPAVSANGSIIWLGQQLQLLYRGSELKGVMAVARVITEKYLANDALRQSEEKYRNIIQNLQFGLIEVDLEEHITFINDAMCDITGYSRKELLGKVASEILTNEEMRKKIHEQHELREQKKSSAYEAEIIKKDGTPIYALISGAPTYDSDHNLSGSIGIHVDITDRKNNELELELFRKELARYTKGLEDLNQITSDPTLTVDQQLEKGLKVVSEYFNLPVGGVVKAVDSRLKVIMNINPHLIPKDYQEYLPLYESISGISFLEQRLIAIPDINSSPYKDYLTMKSMSIQSLLSIPLEVDGKKFGSLVLGDFQPKSEGFSNYDFEFFRLFSRFVSYLLSNQRLQDTIARFNSGLLRLNEIVSNNDLGVSSQLQQGLQVIMDYLDFKKGGILWAKEENLEYLTTIMDTAFPEGKEISIPIQGTPAGISLLENRLIAACDVSNSEFAENPIMNSFGLSSFLFIPYTIENIPVGVIALGDIEVRNEDFNQNELEFFKLFSRFVGYLISNKKNQERIQEKQEALKAKNQELGQQQKFLSSINSFVTKILDQEDVYSIAWEIEENVVEKFGFTDCVIYILNEEKQIFEQLAAYGSQKAKGREILNPVHLSFGEGIVGDVAKNAKAEIVNNTQKDPRYIRNIEGKLSKICIPIIYDGKVLGVIDSEHEKESFFNQEHLDTLTTIANLAASKLKNAKAKRRQAKAEIELRDSVKQLRQVVESALDAIITIDDRGKIKEWNPRAEEIFGWKSEEVIGKLLTENIIPNQHHTSHEKGMEKYMATGVGPALNQRLELNAIRKNKEEFPIELTIIPIMQGGVHSFTAFIRDITLSKSTKDEMEKSLAKERELNELKSRFVAMTSHEFRTPLTTIKQNVDLISFQMEMENPKAMDIYGKYFNRIDSEIGRVTNLMNDILLLGKIEAGKVEISKRESDLVHLAEISIQKICQGRADNRLVKLQVVGVQRKISIDSQLMEQVMTNLLSNALKYSPEAKDPILSISFAKLSEVKITCKDFGIGIPKKEQKGLFSSFYRATNVKNIQGSGLGLSITMEFVLLHKGTISVLSDTNKGSAFIITLPSE